MQTTGVVLDFYDDVNGEGLKRVYPTKESLPEQIKTAHILNSDERAVLRDEAYAVVMQDGGKMLRKFACVDAGNTMLSMIYFEQNYARLPTEAIKVAAANLIGAAERFDIPVPELLKVAAKNGMSRKRDPMNTPATTDEGDWASRTNLVSVQGGADSGRVINTAGQMKTAGKDKNVINLAGKDGTSAGALDVNGLVRQDSQSTNMPAQKSRVVNVTGKTPELRVKKASSTRYALGDKYPIDSYQDVERAVDYWSQHWPAMSPEDRREYAVKTAARASELGITITEELERYGAQEYAPDIEAHIASRKASLPKEAASVYAELQTKMASMEPEEFATVLGEMDKVAGLVPYYGGTIKDPFYSTFGPASKIKQANWYWQSTVGDYLSADDLNWLVRNGRGVMTKHFSHAIVDALQAKPFEVFDSLPDDSKRIIAHMANGRRDGLSAN
jgi:hypothetical protein